MIRIPTLFLLIALFSSAVAQDIQYKTISDIPYYAEEVRRQDSYIGERCLLDIYYPVNKKDFTTVVWFHGGGLTGGNKELPEALKNKDLCIVGINYRLAPGVKAPAYIEDAAAAVAWVFKNIGRYGATVREYLYRDILPEDICP